MTRHHSTAYVKAIVERGRAWKPDPITDQFRFIVRMAYACHTQDVPYDLIWDFDNCSMRATIRATGKIPTPKPLPKAPRLKLVFDWKPAIWDAVYRLEAYHDANRKRMCPGFVIEHSSGLALAHPSESGELGVTEHGGDEDIRQRWMLTHSASGMGFGLTLTFKRATDALLLAASFAVDWTQPANALKTSAECRRAGNTVIAVYGTAHEKGRGKTANGRTGACSVTPNEMIGPIMSTAVDVVPSPSLDQVREYIRASKAENTLRGYQSDWRNFCAWCEGHGMCPMPALPETVAVYIADCAERLKVGSIQRRLNAISEAHKATGKNSPTNNATVLNTIKGIRRVKATAPMQKAAALTGDIRAMVDATDVGIIGARDRALILLGFAGAFRRSELVALDIEDCAFGKDGLTVTLRRSKTDQRGAGRNVGIPYGSNPETCPVRTLQGWIDQAGINQGPLFRSINRHRQLQPSRLAGIDVARVVKKLAEGAGLDAARYAGHSLRAGHATSAAIAGASERSIMNQTGHRSVQMLRRYIRDGSLFRENSAGKLGL